MYLYPPIHPMKIRQYPLILCKAEYVQVFADKHGDPYRKRNVGEQDRHRWVYVRPCNIVCPDIHEQVK